MGIKLNAINSIVIHTVYGAVDVAMIEVWINDKYFSKSGEQAINYSEDYARTVRLNSGYSDTYFSNLIFSDKEISSKEQVIALPTSAIETNMTAGASGIYIADAAGQTLLQTPDVAALIENYGASSPITGIAVVGNPAYKTETGLASLIGVTKAGGSIVEHGTCDLSLDTSAMIMDGWGLSGITITDLQDMQFGWKAGE